MNIDVINFDQDFRVDMNPQTGEFLGHHIREFFDHIPTIRTYGRQLKSPIFEETTSIDVYCGHVVVIEDGKHVNYDHNESHDVIVTTELLNQWKEDLIATHGKIPSRFKYQIGRLKNYILPEINEIDVKDLDWSIIPPYINNLTMFGNGTWWGNCWGAFYVNGHWQGSGLREIGVDVSLNCRFKYNKNPSVMYHRKRKKYKHPEFKITVLSEYELIKPYPNSYPLGTKILKILNGNFIILRPNQQITYKNILNNNIDFCDKNLLKFDEFWKQISNTRNEIYLKA